MTTVTPLTERVFGKDQRTVVNNILQRPYKQTVLLNMTFCIIRADTGIRTMIGKDIVFQRLIMLIVKTIRVGLKRLMSMLE